MADKNLDLNAKIHSAGMTQGGKQGVTALNAIKGAAVAAGAALAGAFATHRMIQIMRQWSGEASRQEAVTRQLSNAVLFTGGSYEKTKGSLSELFTETQRFTNYGDDQQAAVLRTLLTLTGDYNKALRIFKPTIRLAETGIFDANTAALMLSKAMAGNTMALTRYFPVLKDSKDIIGDLSSALDKAAGTAGTFEQALNRLKNSQGDFREAGGQLLNDFLRPLIEDMARFTEESNKAREAYDKFVGAIMGEGALAGKGPGGAVLKAIPGIGDIIQWREGAVDRSTEERNQKFVQDKLDALLRKWGAQQLVDMPMDIMQAHTRALMRRGFVGGVTPPMPTPTGYLTQPTGLEFARMVPTSIWESNRMERELPQETRPARGGGMSQRDLSAASRAKRAADQDEIADMQKAIGEEFSSIMSGAIITAFDEGGGAAVKALGKKLRDSLIGNITDALFSGFGAAIGGGPLSWVFGSRKALG